MTTLAARREALVDWSLGVGTKWERPLIASLAIAGITYLAATGAVESESAVGIYSVVVGYMLGHGAGAAAERRANGKVDV